jgi:hypothetical protein
MSIFWDTTQYCPFKVNQRLGGHIASNFRREENAKQDTRTQAGGKQSTIQRNHDFKFSPKVIQCKSGLAAVVVVVVVVVAPVETVASDGNCQIFLSSHSRSKFIISCILLYDFVSIEAKQQQMEDD